MVDRGKFWTAAPEWRAAEIRRADWSARAVGGLGQTMVSGRIDLAARTLAPGATMAGLWTEVETLPVVVRMARDRALLVSATSASVEAGWRGEGWAASPADDAFSVFEISGAGLEGIVAEATGADFRTGSPSAALLFCGVHCLLYRAAPSTARLHVENGFAAYVWTWLDERAF